MFENSERQRSSPECSNRSKTKSRIRDYKKKISRMSDGGEDEFKNPRLQVEYSKIRDYKKRQSRMFDGVEDGLKIRDYKSNIRKFGTTKKRQSRMIERGED